MALINSDLTWFRQGETFDGCNPAGPRVNVGNGNAPFGELLANDIFLDNRVAVIENIFSNTGVNQAKIDQLTSDVVITENISLTNPGGPNDGTTMFDPSTGKIKNVFINLNQSSGGSLKVDNIRFNNPGGTNDNVDLFDPSNGKLKSQFMQYPSTPSHNSLPGLQGGSGGDYQHLTSSQVTKLNNLPTSFSSVRDLKYLVAQREDNTVVYGSIGIPLVLTGPDQLFHDSGYQKLYYAQLVLIDARTIFTTSQAPLTGDSYHGYLLYGFRPHGNTLFFGSLPGTNWAPGWLADGPPSTYTPTITFSPSLNSTTTIKVTWYYKTF